MTRMSIHSVVAPLLAASLLTDTCRSTVGPGTREDVVPNSYCVRSAVFVVKYIAPAPAASARLVSIGCRRPMAHMGDDVSSICGAASIAGHVWHHLGRRVHPEFCRDAWSRCQRYTARVFNDSLTFATTCTRPCSVCATRDFSLWRPCIHNIRDEARGGQQSARGGGTLERIPCFIARGNPAGAASHAVLEGWYSLRFGAWRASAPLR